MEVRLERNCAVWEKKLAITVYDNREYEGGYYFGKIEIPIKRTGKYKKVGYRECENCYKS